MRLLFSSTTSIRVISSLLLAMSLGEATTACGIFGQACTEMACAYFVNVAVSDLPIDDASRLPIAIDVCDATVCTAFIIIADGEEGPSGFWCTDDSGVRCCVAHSSGFASCTISKNRLVNMSANPEPTLDGVFHLISVVAADADGTTLISATPIAFPGKPYYVNGEDCDADEPCYGSEATVKVGDL